MTAPRTNPTAVVATGLGHLAVLPFVAGAALVWLVDGSLRPIASQALSAYAAVVVSFIGAIHWGLAFSQQAPAARLFYWGVVPSLVACAALLLEPKVGLVVHAAMLVACYGVDRKVYVKEDVGAWLPLRLRLTICATLSCLVGAAGSRPW